MNAKTIYVTFTVMVLICALFFSFCFTKRADDTDIETVVSQIESYKGKHMRWAGKTIGESKADEKSVIVVIKRGYWAMAELKEPLKKSIDKETEVYIEGDVEWKIEITPHSAGGTPIGQAQAVILKNATVEIK
jgi:hypothetical protein